METGLETVVNEFCTIDTVCTNWYNVYNMNTVIPVHQARKQLGELMNQAFYKGTPFVLTRGNKPMAALIGTEEFKEIIKVLEKHDPGLADTLAIMSNHDVQAILDEDDGNIKAGKLIPEEEWLNEN